MMDKFKILYNYFDDTSIFCLNRNEKGSGVNSEFSKEMQV